MPQYPIKVINGEESWTAKLETSKVYQTKVLVIRTTKRKVASRDFIVTIKGVASDDWRDLNSRVLWLQATDEKRTFVDYDGSKVLLDPKFRGKIYNQGVYVCTRPDAPFGFDVRLGLNRDRHLPDEWDLRYAVSRVLAAAVKQKPDLFAEDVAEVLFSGGTLVSSYSNIFTGISPMVDAVDAFFIDTHGEDAEPCADQAQKQELAFFGKRGVIVTSVAALRLLEEKRGTFDTRKAAFESRIIKLHPLAGMADLQRAVYDKGVELLKIAAPNQTGGISIVDFQNESLEGLYDGNSGKVHIAYACLSSFQRFLKVLVHEVAHRMGGEDGSKLHTDNQVALYAEVIEALTVKNN